VVLLSFIAPHRNLDTVRALADRNVTTLAMELVPRISRAQSMDALSSQASIAWVPRRDHGRLPPRQALPAVHDRGRHDPPATVVVLGAGVAGLQAVATAKRLGAIVHVSDIREAARDEVLSLGAKFIDVPDAEDLTGEGGYAKEAGEDFLARQRRS
jgi:H+-translocating NAD(P) transhydrogenase subunit alpha